MTPANVIAAIVLLVVVVLLFHYVRQAHKAERNPFSLTDLLLGEDGKASKAATVMFVALAASTYVIVYQTFKSTLTDLTFAAYLTAWVAPTLARTLQNSKDKP